LGDRAGQPEVQDLAALPATMVHELSNPLAAAHASLHLVMEAIGRSTDLPAGSRLELLDELGLVNDDIDRAIAFLRSMRNRLRSEATG
jgi:signal transduction histidine kinase